MTEAEWLICTEPPVMLDCIRGKASDRKLRLLLCGWSRLHWKWMPEQSRSAVEVAELFADGLASDAERRSADAELWLASQDKHKTIRDWLLRLTLEGNVDLWAAARESRSLNPKVKSKQITILHDIFGNPFRPVSLDPSWLTWHDGLIVSMARQMYDSRDFTEMPILADALEEASCTDASILGHLRGPGPHVRGCWAVDLVIGKE